MAKSAIAAGWEVTVYARWHRGSRRSRSGMATDWSARRSDWRYLVPGSRRRRRCAAATGGRCRAGTPANRRDPDAGKPADDSALQPLERWHWWQRIREFPLQPMGWAVAPRRRGRAGRYLARHVGRISAGPRPDAPAAWRPDRSTTAATCSCGPGSSPDSVVLAGTCWNGRNGAGHARADRVLTVNDAYAGLLEDQLRVPRPTVVMNCSGDLDSALSPAGSHP